jgi:16S rRNA (cytosine967-C5)-methyltransferase
LLPLLKPQGRLVYATCTVHPRENSQLMDAVLADHPELQLQRSWQLWPGEAAGAGDGFYAALLQQQG